MAKERFPISKHELELRCPLVTVEVTDHGIIGRHASGEIAIQVHGKITKGLVQKFSDTYQVALKGGLIKKGLPH